MCLSNESLNYFFCIFPPHLGASRCDARRGKHTAGQPGGGIFPAQPWRVMMTSKGWSTQNIKLESKYLLILLFAPKTLCLLLLSHTLLRIICRIHSFLLIV